MTAPRLNGGWKSISESRFDEGKAKPILIKDSKGNELLEILRVDEKEAGKFAPLTHALAVVKLGGKYLLGWNHWRQDWEIFGDCREKGETLRACIARECREELGIENGSFTYLGLMHLNMAPGYFNPERHEEYGGLFGLALKEGAFPELEAHRQDREEIEKLAFYTDIKEKEKIAEIDEKLLEYWQ